MTKEELKKIVSSLNLDQELVNLVYELIDGTDTVNKELLNAVADIIETNVEFLQNSADLLEEEADRYEALKQELETIDAEEENEVVQAIAKNNEDVMNDIKAKIDQMNGGSSQPTPTVTAVSPSAEKGQSDSSKLEEITKNLAQASQG